MAGKSFWDTSALLPLIVNQTTSARARAVTRKLPQQVVWWGTPIEIRSALARLVRDGELDASDLPRALARFEYLRGHWQEVEPTERVRRLALELPERRGLRALDAMQLAGALAWCNERPRGRHLVTFDNPLATAAEIEGFDVHRILAR
jgi:predicted nucleic acid-binding protein